MEWDKISAIHILKIKPQIHNSSSNTITQKNPIKKWAEELNIYFFQGMHINGPRYINRSSTPLFIRKMQMRYLTIIQMTIIKEEKRSVAKM